jgi:hypothetical protein
MFPRSLSRCRLLAAQLLLILIGVPVLAFYPPVQGPMLLVPLSADARAAMVRVATDHGARLMARGPLPGSIVIWGERAALSGPLMAHAVVVMAGDAAACGRSDDEVRA